MSTLIKEKQNTDKKEQIDIIKKSVNLGDVSVKELLDILLEDGEYFTVNYDNIKDYLKPLK